MSTLQNGTQEVFARASIDGYVVYLSLLLLILSGVLAGVFPAKKAAEIMPIETLNSEK
jgi:ABC-type lipoprotein release transport system permease subunit